MVDQAESRWDSIRPGQGAIKHLQPGDAEETHTRQVEEQHDRLALKFAGKACSTWAP